jgi:hypothetical protein
MAKDPRRCIEKDRLSEFDYRVVIFGSREFTDAQLFNHCMQQYLRIQGFDQDDMKPRVCFVLSEDTRGVATLAREWCLKHGYHWSGFLPNWSDIDIEGALVRTNRRGQPYNALAGLWCSIEMADVSTHGISFYDGVSSDTQDMIDRVAERGSPCATYLVTIDRDEDEDAEESQGRGGGNT